MTFPLQLLPIWHNQPLYLHYPLGSDQADGILRGRHFVLGSSHCEILHHAFESKHFHYQQNVNLKVGFGFAGIIRAREAIDSSRKTWTDLGQQIRAGVRNSSSRGSARSKPTAGHWKPYSPLLAEPHIKVGHSATCDMQNILSDRSTRVMNAATHLPHC